VDVLLELYRWFIQAYCWHKENDMSDEDFQTLKKRCTSTDDAKEREEIFGRRVKPMFTWLTRIYFVKQVVMIVWSGTYTFLNKDMATNPNSLTDVSATNPVHKHYLSYNFIKLSFIYILTNVLGHLFREWRKGVALDNLVHQGLENKSVTVGLMGDETERCKYDFPATKNLAEW